MARWLSRPAGRTRLPLVRSYLAISSLLLTRCTTNLHHTAKYTRPSFRCPAQMYRPFALVAKLVHSTAYAGITASRPRSYGKNEPIPRHDISTSFIAARVCIARKSYSRRCVLLPLRVLSPIRAIRLYQFGGKQTIEWRICLIIYGRRQERRPDVAK